MRFLGGCEKIRKGISTLVFRFTIPLFRAHSNRIKKKKRYEIKRKSGTPCESRFRKLRGDGKPLRKIRRADVPLI